MPRPQPRLLLGQVKRLRILSSKGERELAAALSASDAAGVEQAAGDDKLGQPAGALAGLLWLGSDDQKAVQLLRDAVAARWGPRGVWETEFMKVHFSSAEYQLGLSYGRLGVEVPLRESLDLSPRTLKLALSLALEGIGEVAEAIEVALGVEPTFLNRDVIRLVLADQYTQVGDFEAIVKLTEGITNKYNYGAFLCAYRGMAFRRLALYSPALEAFKEALKSEQRLPVIRYAALSDRSRAHAAMGSLVAARRDLKRILAENPSIPGIRERLEALQTPGGG
jgi:tetratricopeptide (TPR) repeat protein